MKIAPKFDIIFQFYGRDKIVEEITAGLNRLLLATGGP